MILKEYWLLITFFLTLFLVLAYFILESQKIYREENDNLVIIRINYLNLLSFLPYLFLNIFLILICVISFRNSNYIITCISSIISLIFLIPIINGLNHFLLEMKRKIYYDRANDRLIVKDNKSEIVIDLVQHSPKLEHYSLKRTVKGGITSLEKMRVYNNKNEIVLSSILSYPFDFEMKYKIDKIQTNKLFIWI